MASTTPARFVVLKFGGTSVSQPDFWRTIAGQAEERLAEGLRPLIVCSALSGITDRLDALLDSAVRGETTALLGEIRARHDALARGMGLDAPSILSGEYEEIERLALGASLLRDAGPRLRARFLAFGELLSTRLGAAFLRSRGLPAAWIDARSCLMATDEPTLPEARRLLSATAGDDFDPDLHARLAAMEEKILVTQGFIARDGSGTTVLLGRGGSDTSAALFAARLGAERCEIWTDVPGVFTAHPRLVPEARLLRFLDYDEAQEIASQGSKVLHPRSIAPCRRHGIPIEIRWTERPDSERTRIAREEGRGEAQVKAISQKSGITLVSMETSGMWQQVGFLADVFARFRAHGLSIDLVSTSEMNVTVSLDPIANALDPAALDALAADLGRICRVEVIGGCAAVSLVGRGIRAILHQLGPALSLFEEKRILLVSQAASDLNLTFVVEEEEAERLVRSLHALLFAHAGPGALLGPTWPEMLHEGSGPAEPGISGAWWRGRREELLARASEGTPVYVYDEGTIRERLRSLRGHTRAERIYYALKANPHEGVLRCLHAEGVGFECVSRGEIERVLGLFPSIPPGEILFTPNFAPREEYAFALERGCRVTLDGLHPLARWGDLLAGREVFLRLDPGRGRGHHEHVRTAGAGSKFGIAREDIEEIAEAAKRCGARVVGLHAHVGSGILVPETWGEVALFLAQASGRFPEARVLDLGGGFGVPERAGQAPLDLEAVGNAIARVKLAHPGLQFWLEPGRYLIAEAGVLLGRVTQVKRKGEAFFVGTDVGMNSLLRPALYGSHHEIVNLTRLEAPRSMTAHVVGPICESADVLGYARPLPPTEEGDILLFASSGAYGAAMSSRYNLREPAREEMLPAPGAR